MTDGLLFRRSYQQRVLSVAGDALIAYWPLTEPSGAVAFDVAGYRRNGAYTGVDLNYPGIGDGGVAPLFDGVNDYCNIYSAGMATAFNPSEGSFGLWLKVASSGVWTDATTREAGQLRASANNRLGIEKSVTNNTLVYTYRANATTKAVTKSGVSALDWIFAMLTWSVSADQVKAYYNGVQEGAAQTALGVWAGALNAANCVLGSVSTTVTNPWSGFLAHAAIWARALSAGEVAELYRIS